VGRKLKALSDTSKDKRQEREQEQPQRQDVLKHGSDNHVQCWHVGPGNLLQFPEPGPDGQPTGRIIKFPAGLQVCCNCKDSPIKLVYYGINELGHGPNVLYQPGIPEIIDQNQIRRPSGAAERLYLPDGLAERLINERRGGRA
jgi:hypothetical protein